MNIQPGAPTASVNSSCPSRAAADANSAGVRREMSLECRRMAAVLAPEQAHASYTYYLRAKPL